MVETLAIGATGWASRWTSAMTIAVLVSTGRARRVAMRRPFIPAIIAPLAAVAAEA